MDSPFRFLGNGPADEQPSVQPKSSASPPMDGEADDFEAAHDAVDFSSMNQQPEASAPGMQDSAPYEGPALDSGDSASGGHADDDHATPEDCHEAGKRRKSRRSGTLSSSC